MHKVFMEAALQEAHKAYRKNEVPVGCVAVRDGTIIARDVVVGNIYDEKDTLLTISELDTLWVWGQVYERDLSTITVGLPW